MKQEPLPKLERVDDYRWLIPRSGDMRTEGMVYAGPELMELIREDPCLRQVANVAKLPGIVGRSLGMPDIHWGYGFPIGGVAAFDPDEGVVSPGGVGYDINCGVRLLSSTIPLEELQPQLEPLLDGLTRNIPAGVGSSRRDLKLSRSEARHVLRDGARWAVRRGYGVPQDVDAIEEGGALEGADPDVISDRALERGRAQLGTVGSGNHFVEVGWVEEVYDAECARAFGLEAGTVTVMIHSGSRGLGYQVCDDFLRVMLKASSRHGIQLPDRQLAAAPAGSDEGRRYLAGMKCAANYAFANRQLMTHWTRESFAEIFPRRGGEPQLELVYDVCHNIAKYETHEVAGQTRRVLVHRKGATRALPPGHPSLVERHRQHGQPVLIPGDMGRYSYVLVGTDRAARESFASSCHGAGRVLSRKEASRRARGRSLFEEMRQRGVSIRAAGRATVAEEMPEAYKDVADVVGTVDGAGLALKVARLKPIGVVKG
jgi:tRNA-splicing ligase RtcB